MYYCSLQIIGADKRKHLLEGGWRRELLKENMHTRTRAMHLMTQSTSVGTVKHLYKQSNEFSIVDEQ